ncbi:MAG: hypothetical protein ACRDD4_12870 [Culicoidibacterales bacterium]
MSKPQGIDLSAILNTFRKTATNAYQAEIPLATAKNIKDVGSALLTATPQVRNEFMTNLYNKVGLSLIDSPTFSNELSFIKKGRLDYGQSIEEIYVGWANAEEYITGMKEDDNGKLTPPDPFSIRKVEHYSAFYSVVLSRQYQVTRHLTDLNKAFHSANGVEAFISALMNSLASAEEFDDYRMTIALMARQIEEAQKADSKHKGTVKLITGFNKTVPTAEQVTAENCMSSMKFLNYMSKELKRWSSRMTKPRIDLNFANVIQVTPKSRQRCMILQDIVADFENELFAWAYNADTLKLGALDEIDAWYSLGATETQGTVTPDALTVKSDIGEGTCVAVLYDPDMLKYYNKERIASDQNNAKGNYWNFFMSLEDILGCSPYKQFVAFTLE